MDLKNFQFNKICHFANHPYLCKGLYLNYSSTAKSIKCMAIHQKIIRKICSCRQLV
ncbi:MAG: hypothetical protein H0A76_02745 [Candidatus Thiodubiliella endoseptemdiera]|uniref:Uncharacterized protein n=1 Tax=Candidatus Thiodubiliella endoseptemdiera TaxID=2738886 RepID=A0A853F072_9GAMM|nr:hypothetical protein [Candidatus Thiodubiliella endoseptemdiera]